MTPENYSFANEMMNLQPEIYLSQVDSHEELISVNDAESAEQSKFIHNQIECHSLSHDSGSNAENEIQNTNLRTF